MGKQLYETSPYVRQIFQEHDAICRKLDLPSFIDLITQNNMTFASASPIQTQLAIVSFDLVTANLWQHWGIQPNAVTGFSLGQFPALVMAGVISLSDMFFLVGKRAEMMVKECTAGTHAMVATFGMTA
jgi:acyl transferase domain-containing protein